LHTYLKLRWAKMRKARVATMNLAPPGGWPGNYRIPDLILWTADRDAGNKNTHFEGPPNVAIEIRSPGDESYEKLPFYAQLGVPEVWIIDRDSKKPEIHRLRDGRYEIVAANAEGWVYSPETGIALRVTDTSRLAIHIPGDDSSLAELPED
jgi:Uma2 family endonuclease